MIGQTVSHYKILEKLGSGGMGQVYLADDLNLGRKVAIKFLSEHLTKDKENVERFEREAKAAATLNHPNIVTVYDIAEDDNQTFIVMEYISGESLRDKINRGILNLNEIINLCHQICDGLQEAHHFEILHRDIKPENM
jgi:serine/threonine protein kinase